jgi:hypothetical protein
MTDFYRVNLDMVLARRWIRAMWRDRTEVRIVIAPARDVVLRHDDTAAATATMDKLCAWLEGQGT